MKTFNGLQGLTSEEPNRAKGFSLIEVLVVVAIILIIAGIAVPNMLPVISNARVRAGVTSLSGLLQNCRMMAVKENKTLTTRFVTVNGATLLGYVKLASDTSALKDTDSQAEWEAPVIMMTSPTGVGHPDVISTSVLGFTPETTEPSFNPRGLPCVYSGGTCANNGFLYYFKDTSRQGNKGWAALSISPAGRIKKWFWNGVAWTD
jgi:prepilin-type N-terminal cleavage/methylation domain-containing protein